jgi:hypothetical protein
MMISMMMMNQYQWSQVRDIRHWLINNRLDGMSKMIRDIDRNDAGKQDILRRMRLSAMPAMAKLQTFMAQIYVQNRPSKAL